MDVKLLACSSIAAASFSVLMFDFLTYVPTTNSRPTTPTAIYSNNATATHTAEVAQSSLAGTAELSTHLPAVASAIQRVRLNSFEHPQIGGVLLPNGVQRAHWSPPTNGLWVTSKPFDTQRLVVLLDPGHGGTDPGAIAHNGLIEKVLTLDIAERTKLYLSKYPNIDVLFTRDDDVGLSRLERVHKISSSDADLVISLHFNDLPQTDIALVETYYAGQSNIQESKDRQREKANGNSAFQNVHRGRSSADFSFTNASRQLANTLQKHVFSEVGLNNPTAHNAGVKNETLFVLTQSYKPGALMELTCLSHPGEAEKLATDEYRNRLSKALANAVLEYRRERIRQPMTFPVIPTTPAALVHWQPTDAKTLLSDPHAV